MANTWTTLLDAVYPVGSVYISYSTTSPATRFGGTWSAITGFPWLRKSTAVGTTGGEETHVLSVEEMPRHSHQGSEGANWDLEVSAGANSGTIRFTAFETYGPWQYHQNPWCGGSNAHNNLPPYYVLRGWRRTA